jgi:hypothetical protein
MEALTRDARDEDPGAENTEVLAELIFGAE